MSNLESMEVIATLQKSCDVLAKAVCDLQDYLKNCDGDHGNAYQLTISNQILEAVGEDEYF
ncbi:hypothetical protein OEK97_28605, partial [Escherichia coli]|uniref:hypothetical protein n=1 Tax=Escherichia coli TaxID=562 RepID=UPI0021D839B7